MTEDHTLYGWQKTALRLGLEKSRLSEKLAQKDARIARLEAALQKIVDETPANQHEKWHHHHFYLVTARDALNETDRQSLAAVKAEALREYAEHKREQAIEAGQGARRDRCNRMASNAEAYADRIEQEETHEGSLRENREAKEES